MNLEYHWICYQLLCVHVGLLPYVRLTDNESTIYDEIQIQHVPHDFEKLELENQYYNSN